MLKCFEQDIKPQLLDRQPFKFHHNLMGHPSLELTNLAKVIPTLPPNHVTFSKKLLETGADFEATFRSRPAGAVLEEIFENIRVTDSYIMVSALEAHPSFAELRHDLLTDVEGLMASCGIKGSAANAKLYLFVASPNGVTPFHIDRYSTFLMQFRGSKQVTVFPPWDERVVTNANREAYVAYVNTRLPWSKDIDKLGQCYDFAPGEALHIPFVSGHHVKNGGEDISISMSIIFNTVETLRWRHALCFNYAQRRVLGSLGIRPSPVGQFDSLDGAKSMIWKIYSKARGWDPE